MSPGDDPEGRVWNNETSWCFIHEVQEPIPEETWEVCFECKHVYVTKQDFVDAYNAVIKEMRENTQYPAADKTKLKDLTPERADSIGFCQFCMHDF
jgi:cupin superfamily acireductone dioxygenase involved in methionine salvage